MINGLGFKVATGFAIALAMAGTFAAIQTHRIDRLKTDVALQKQVAANLAGRVVASEGRRAFEIAQCSDSVAALIDQNKAEVAKATAAATARASLTRACPSRPLTPAERLAALRINSGESK
jgi:hypothetical protein